MVPHGLWFLPAVTFSTFLISSSGSFHCSCGHGTSRNIYTRDYWRMQHITHEKIGTQTRISSLVINFLRNGKQALRLTVESKSTRRACVWTTNQFVRKILKTVGQVSTCSTAVSLTAWRSCSAFFWNIALWGNYHRPQRKAAPCEMEESGLQGRSESLCSLS